MKEIMFQTLFKEFEKSQKNPPTFFDKYSDKQLLTLISTFRDEINARKTYMQNLETLLESAEKKYFKFQKIKILDPGSLEIKEDNCGQKTTSETINGNDAPETPQEKNNNQNRFREYTKSAESKDTSHKKYEIYKNDNPVKQFNSTMASISGQNFFNTKMAKTERPQTCQYTLSSKNVNENNKSGYISLLNNVVMDGSGPSNQSSKRYSSATTGNFVYSSDFNLKKISPRVVGTGNLKRGIISERLTKMKMKEFEQEKISSIQDLVVKKNVLAETDKCVQQGKLINKCGKKSMGKGFDDKMVKLSHCKTMLSYDAGSSNIKGKFVAERCMTGNMKIRRKYSEVTDDHFLIDKVTRVFKKKHSLRG